VLLLVLLLVLLTFNLLLLLFLLSFLLKTFLPIYFISLPVFGKIPYFSRCSFLNFSKSALYSAKDLSLYLGLRLLLNLVERLSAAAFKTNETPSPFKPLMFLPKFLGLIKSLPNLTKSFLAFGST